MVRSEADVKQRLDAIGDAERRLRATVAALTDEDLSAPTLCSEWSRSHVIAHVALNAHSIVNLIEWARTGRERPQYLGWEERESDIEAEARRNVAEHVAALSEGAAAFEAAARSLPLDRWDFPVRGITGREQPVRDYLKARRREVEIHHVDLLAGYRPADWPDDFVRETLEGVPARLGPDAQSSFDVEADDLGLTLTIGAGPPQAKVSGTGRSLLMWLLGRSDGDDLRSGGALPVVPGWG